MTKKRAEDHVAAKKNLAVYEDWDKAIPTMSGHMSDVFKLKCVKCGSGARHVISYYAFTRGENWRLLSCNCKGKLVWFELKGVSDEKATKK